MKNLTRLLFALALGLALASSAFAEAKQITTLNTTTAKTIVVPGPQATIVTITNTGSNAINFTFDSGSAFGGVDPTTGATGLGQPLQPGQTASFYGPYVNGKRIVGIMQTGTTTINVTTNAPLNNSNFPTP